MGAALSWRNCTRPAVPGDAGGCRPTTWLLHPGRLRNQTQPGWKFKDKCWHPLPDSRGPPRLRPDTHPWVEPVTRATLFSRGSRRVALELAIRTDFQDRTQPLSSTSTLCMAPTTCAKLSAYESRKGRGAGRLPSRASVGSGVRARPWAGPLLPLSARPPRGEQAVVAGAPCRLCASQPSALLWRVWGSAVCPDFEGAGLHPRNPQTSSHPPPPICLPTSFFRGQGGEVALRWLLLLPRISG